MTLHISYQITPPNTKMQAVASADRPLCALVSALAACRAGLRMGGMLPSDRPVADAVLAELLRLDVPADRAEAWASAVNGLRHTFPITAEVVGATLNEYQINAVRNLSPCGGIIAMGTGLGKTITAIAAVTAISQKRNRLWIAAPLNAMGSWRRYEAELRQTWDEVGIVSLDSLHKLKFDSSGGTLILDEVHLLGQVSARRTKAAHSLRARFDVCIGLTGTFLHGGIEKSLSMLDLAVPGGALFASRWGAGEYFACLAKKKIGTRTATALERPTGVAKERFFAFLGRLVSYVGKTDADVVEAIGLPGQYLHTVKLGQPWAEIEDIAAQMVHQIIAETGELPHAQAIAHALCSMGAGEKVAWLADALGDSAVVVFAQYTATITAAEATLTDMGVTFATIDGTTSSIERTRIRDRFVAGEIRVVIAQQIAGGIGMDGLQERTPFSACLDHSWRPDAYAQMTARTHRRGQTADCHHFDFICNALQQRVLARIRAGEVFDRECGEWLTLKLAIDQSRTRVGYMNHTAPVAQPVAQPQHGQGMLS